MTEEQLEDRIESGFKLENSFAEQMEGFYLPWQSVRAPSPELIRFNSSLANELGIQEVPDQSDLATIYSGLAAPEGSRPLAQVYAGHQFGGFSEQLGDGRALLLGEVIDEQGGRRDIQLKGSGRTPFSRGGDGKAVLGPVLREYIVGEAMHALGVPTTRALAAVTTGESVRREGPKPGAVLARVAASHIRVGTFQFFAARGETARTKQLIDYVITRHYPEIDKNSPSAALDLFKAVRDRQAALIAKWMLVGFVHGVMNTDNMTISGETIDYGPCAFIDTYDPKAVFSSIDTQGRYAYGNQPVMARWNLARFAETLLPLIDSDTDRAVELATTEVMAFAEIYQRYWLSGMRDKMGLRLDEEGDLDLANELFSAMEGQNVDFTLMFNCLALAIDGETSAVEALFDDATAFNAWVIRWHDRRSRETASAAEQVALMNQSNPVVIPRNYLVEEALQVAEQDKNFSVFERLTTVLEKPFEEREGIDRFKSPPSSGFGPYQTFCGT
jgi:uncharacterized protein YdiU (UPF0061 family)